VRIRTLLGLPVAAAMALVLATPASAQTPSTPSTPPTQAQPPAPTSQDRAPQPLRSPVEGDLVSVDAVAKQITIKPLTGADLVFVYTDKTEISGAQKDAAGLATMKEGRVTVHFTEDAQTKAKTATRINVSPKK
jgi:hypothetical protein